MFKYFLEANGAKALIMFFLIVILLSLVINVILYFVSSFEKDIVVKEKYIRYRRRSSNYNVVAEDGTIYQIKNVWFKGDFNRADDYAKLEVGKKYRVKGYGYRVSMLDMYPGIYEIN